MRHSLALGAVVLAWLASAPAPADAKNISISVTPTLEIGNGKLVARVKIGNSGDEAARSVTPVLRFRDQETRGTPRTALAPNETMDATVEVPTGELGAGRWPYRLAVDYTDANEYPFQALQVGTVLVGSPPPAKIAVPEMKLPGMASSGSLTMKVKNLAGTDRKVVVNVIVPDGLEVTRPIDEFVLPAWGEQSASAALVNRTALAGSRYPVFAAVQYEDEPPAHQTVIAQAVVEILPPQSFFGTRRNLLWLAAGALVMVWLGIMLWRTVARPRAALPAGRR
jgi:hypothetical protein